ncbi:MAG: polyribonucleotide nucleotidyltransferase [Candidatus Komeilibacteria bacterium CG10_big_fil_rev_8_21_14_0_10_41_13]|uniref:Polyribonucleotide nucleotidyltransferase n=1 Tax=Candidatus Komeilibacteria bacterium CG10_big_fil_rev_8_21_14_0_10_41_13 TaxID=1974476 RepID=A0A2M6WCK7_9BACT|nr:MAG: polyribonucleotide nucleotidyltransferase [Candidatus Komeilibacteria bacterium CG10_big_fil_rev_8_21_14_0_10_41_13]
MQKIQDFELEYAGKPLKVQIGKLAHQAHGSCTVQYGETVVLATAVMGSEAREGIDYFPLMVDYEEKLYAAGKIKGSRWIKREGRATDEAVLTARIIDRSIRPLFKETERKDVQVMVTILAYDEENDPDVPALIAASTALAISPIPWNGPVGAIRVGQIDGEWLLNGSTEARAKSPFDLYLAGTSEEAVMIEFEGKEIDEKTVDEAIQFGHKHLKKVVKLVEEIQAKVGAAKKVEEESEEAKAEKAMIRQKVEAHILHKIGDVFSENKEETKANIKNLHDEINEILKADNEVSKDARAKGLAMIDEYLSEAARRLVMEKDIRTDGRKLNQIRPLSAEVALLPRVHGSGLFERGETQVLSVVTLGGPGAEQYLDGMEEEGKKRYMHHYNFPGFSVGEVKPSRGPGRREIGHGALAEKALIQVLPDQEAFPYTIRVVSEVLGSNGSSSQASICGSTLSLMDAGVPIKAPVAGIAMGLVTDPKNKKNYKILTDIQGIEDHAFDMDFKVAGTENGITAIQLDIKLGGINLDICGETLVKAKEARLEILEVMKKAISEPRAELSPHAPRIITMHIDPEKIRDVIGSGGKTIHEITEKCEVEIDIEQDGTVFVTSANQEGAAKAVKWIEDLTREIEVGEEYEGTVTQIIKGQNNGEEIGAIVELMPGRDGMVHISNVDWKRIDKVTDVLNIGDTVKVKVMEVDKDRGRIGLSRKELLPKPEGYEERPPRGPRPPRRDDHRGGDHSRGRKPFFKR